MENLRASGLSHRNKADLDSKRASAAMTDSEEVLFNETPSDEILRRSHHLPPSQRSTPGMIVPQDFKREPVPPKKDIPKGLSPSTKRSHKSHKINFSDMSVGDYVYREGKYPGQVVSIDHDNGKAVLLDGSAPEVVTSKETFFVEKRASSKKRRRRDLQTKKDKKAKKAKKAKKDKKAKKAKKAKKDKKAKKTKKVKKS